MLDLRGELTEMTQGCCEVVLGQGSSHATDDHTYLEVSNMADAVRLLEDMLSQHQYLKTVRLLHIIRKQWKGEGEFGSMEEEDDVDCLFFIYARYLADQQEGESSKHDLLIYLFWL